ncbi:MAG: hypothetical protein H6667_15720 [Ardenticatenaceae bacterium]|nr:hypothetical protein [Ardenticatenaceae bacterium]
MQRTYGVLGDGNSALATRLSEPRLNQAEIHGDATAVQRSASDSFALESASPLTVKEQITTVGGLM